MFEVGNIVKVIAASVNDLSPFCPIGHKAVVVIADSAFCVVSIEGQSDKRCVAPTDIVLSDTLDSELSAERQAQDNELAALYAAFKASTDGATCRTLATRIKMLKATIFAVAIA